MGFSLIIFAGGDTMYNLELLKRKIAYSGIKLTVLSYKLGMSRTTLWSRLNDKSEFTSDEIKDLCRILYLNEDERNKIFNKSSMRNDCRERMY